MLKPIKILYIDDSKTDRELVSNTFKHDRNNFEVVTVSNRKEFEENLRKSEYDLVLTDFNILGLDGFQVCDIVKSVNDNIPIVVITGTGSEEAAVELMKKGVSDYVIKSPSHIKRLPSTIISVLEREKVKFERQKAQQELEISLKKYKVLFESFPLGINITDKDGKIIESNLESEKLLGAPKDKQAKRKPDSEEWKIIRSDGSPMLTDEFAGVRALKENRLIENVEMGIINGEKEITWLSATAAPIPIEGYGVAIAYNDISGSKIEENKKNLAMQILEMLNQSMEKTEIIRKILLLVKKYTGFEAVGIRLQQGEDYPYYETNGFRQEFVDLERYLCERDSNGKIKRDSRGKALLEGLCGNIISQRIDPSLPFFTNGGSFWTNSSTELLAQTTDKERQTQTRNRCNTEGYESVGLIPLKSKNEIIGLLQLNDHRKNMFTREMIVFFEGIGNSIGIALTQKIMMESIRKNEERLNLALEATSDAIWDRNYSTKEDYLSPKYYEMLGYKQGEFLSNFDGWKRLIHPDDIDDVNKVFGSYSENVKDNNKLEFRMRAKNGEWRWILSRGKIVERNSEGKPVRMIGTNTDFTERKRMEEDLKRKNRALRILSECNGTIVKSIDEIELTKEICNKIYSIGEYLLVWIGLAMNDEIKSVCPIACAGKEPDTVKFLNITWSDSERGLSPTGKAIRNGTFALIRDVKSDQGFIPWLGDALKHGYYSLISLPLLNENRSIGALTIYSSEVNGFDDDEIKLLTELTNDLSFGILALRAKEDHDKLENQLLQSQKIEAIGRLAGGIAHDFNNILTLILGNSDLMLLELDDKESTIKHLGQIKTATKKAASLTNQLLVFSRKQIIQPKILDLNKIVTEMQKMLQRLIGEDIDLAVILDPRLWKIEADQSHIDQIIMNLVVNSKDAMPNGGDLTIRTYNFLIGEEDIGKLLHAKQGKYIILEIKDTGTGISEEIISKIFDPFFTTKESGRGTGLGLSVVHGIVVQNQGWIDVSSEEGKGTTFKIYFPAVEKDSGDEKIIINSLNQFKGDSERILVLEDDHNIREMTKQALTGNGYIVIEAMNIQKAFDILEKEKGNFDLIFSDIILPDGSGIDFFEKAILIYPNLKVLFTSGYIDEKVNWQNIKEKKYDFIQKPYEIITLLKVIHEKIKS
jgi:PAS domain S-box-containing protein